MSCCYSASTPLPQNSGNILDIHFLNIFCVCNQLSPYALTSMNIEIIIGHWTAASPISDKPEERWLEFQIRGNPGILLSIIKLRFHFSSINWSSPDRKSSMTSELANRQGSLRHLWIMACLGKEQCLHSAVFQYFLAARHIFATKSNKHCKLVVVVPVNITWTKQHSENAASVG